MDGVDGAADLLGDIGGGEMLVENELDGLTFNVIGEANAGHGNDVRGGNEVGSTIEPITPTVSRQPGLKQQRQRWNPYGMGAENGFAASDIGTENGLSPREAMSVNGFAPVASTAADAVAAATNVKPFTVFASAVFPPSVSTKVPGVIIPALASPFSCPPVTAILSPFSLY